MKRSTVIIKRNLCVHNGKEYDYELRKEISGLLETDIKIIILEEELYAKHFSNIIKRNKLQEFIDYKINSDLIQNGDILYDFEKKKNIIAIYSIKGAKRVEIFLDKAKNIKIIPIQFIIKDIMFKSLKNKYITCNVLIKFREYYYYISIKDGLFYYGFVEENEEIIFEKITRTEIFEEIYVDVNINSLLLENKFNVIKINLGDLIDEKIYQKQRFHFRKVL